MQTGAGRLFCGRPARRRMTRRINGLAGPPAISGNLLPNERAIATTCGRAVRGRERIKNRARIISGDGRRARSGGRIYCAEALASLRVAPTRAASEAAMKASRPPSSTAAGLPVSTPVRRSFTSW